MTTGQPNVGAAVGAAVLPAPPLLMSRVEMYGLRARSLPPREDDIVRPMLADLAAAARTIDRLTQEASTYLDRAASVAAELESTKREAATLLALLPDAYLVTDLEGCIRAANRAASRLFNAAGVYARGKPLQTYFAAAERERFARKLERVRALPSGRSLAWEAQLRNGRRDGARSACVRAAAIRDGDGIPTALCWLVQEVTTRLSLEARVHALEEQVRAQEAVIARRVRERTAELEAIIALQQALLDGAAESQGLPAGVGLRVVPPDGALPARLDGMAAGGGPP